MTQMIKNGINSRMAFRNTGEDVVDLDCFSIKVPEDLYDLIITELECNLQDCKKSSDDLFEILRPLLTQIGHLSHEEAEFLSWQIFDIIDVESSKDMEDEVDEDEDDFGEHECQMCERIMPLTFHHLFPKKVHKRIEERKRGDKGEATGIPKHMLRTCGIMICRPCHSMLHKTFDHRTLAEEKNTLERICQDPKIVSWISYARKQKELDPRLARFGLKYKR